MVDATPPGPSRSRLIPERGAIYRMWVRLAGSRRFQRAASAVPGVRRLARRDGEQLFDLVAGFVYSQVLYSFVALDFPKLLQDEPLPVWRLAARTEIDPQRMQVLCQAAASLGLLKRRRDGRYGLGRLGAALPGVPGLTQMIRHHDVLYRDLADPVGFLKSEGETELARFWPYVFGVEGANDPEVAETYSQLMSDSQTLVAEETLRAIDLRGATRLMDVGGGTGAFLRSVHGKYPDLQLRLFDLPAVVAGADVPAGTEVLAGSFREDALPEGSDVITLVRVLYDHADHTVLGLLKRVLAALPEGGRIVVSEPMGGGDRPARPGDAYFALYTLAMQTGCTRSPEQISALLTRAGFRNIKKIKTFRPFVTGVLVANKPG